MIGDVGYGDLSVSVVDDETLGATTEPWPLVAQLVRRASFDLLSAYTERAQLEPSDAAVVDRLTTLYTRPLFEAVLAKELERASRFVPAWEQVTRRVRETGRRIGEHVGRLVAEAPARRDASPAE